VLSVSLSVLLSPEFFAFGVGVAEFARVVPRFREAPAMFLAALGAVADGALSEKAFAGRAAACAPVGVSTAAAGAQVMPVKKQSGGQCFKAAISSCYGPNGRHFFVGRIKIAIIMALRELRLIYRIGRLILILRSLRSFSASAGQVHCRDSGTLRT